MRSSWSIGHTNVHSSVGGYLSNVSPESINSECSGDKVPGSGSLQRVFQRWTYEVDNMRKLGPPSTTAVTPRRVWPLGLIFPPTPRSLPRRDEYHAGEEGTSPVVCRRPTHSSSADRPRHRQEATNSVAMGVRCTLYEREGGGERGAEQGK